MAFWNVDLTKSAGARSAVRTGSNGAFVAAAQSCLGLAVAALTGHTIGYLIGVGVEIAIFLVAGIKLRGGKGAYWGIGAAILLVLEMAVKIVSLFYNAFNMIGIVIGLGAVTALVTGVRGAMAFRRGLVDADLAGVFE